MTLSATLPLIKSSRDGSAFGFFGSFCDKHLAANNAFPLPSATSTTVGVASFFSLFTHNFHSVQSSSGASSPSAVHDEL